ncbi:uncharacterized protein TRAVEDRAFT_69608 [Trametes versicolor FP-101664 SS1]|uniref:uncharacterized protein n=1 Tax=Trametes versicolor (strain FP-101664) TaxID=717944 RepID=UPI00046219D8|nr:uncharacterized protein TRAVEDRAFT_69608 [Trametes versicolor FP-101664 SS1]EIW61192.1 hypothetical protein TRAVEDRAFT_69608 [Trametes versicolor FP-101664 SS1]
MPMDIFLEIVRMLHPMDLLRLSRSSKHFRSLLMTQNSRSLWRAAFGNVPGVPPCPPYYPEPRYAAVLFDQYCFACGNARSTKVDYTACVRLCAPCFKINFEAWVTIYAAIQDSVGVQLPEEVRTIMPSLCGRSFLGYYEHYQTDARSNDTVGTYYTPESYAIADEALSLTAPGELSSFFEERWEFVTAMQNHAVSVLEWLDRCDAEKYANQNALRADRRAAILERLGELGYTTTDYPEDRAWKNIVDQPKKLTERIWTTVLPKLRILIEKKREGDRQAIFEYRLAERRAEFRLFYDFFLQSILSASDRQFAPNWHDTCVLPAVHQLLAENDAKIVVTEKRISVFKEGITHAVRASASQIKHDLMEMLHREQYEVHNTPAMPPYDMAQIDAELAKASSLFLCNRCSHTVAASAPDICAHWRAKHPTLQWNDKWPIEEPVDLRRGPYGWPSSLPWVSAMPFGQLRTRTALTALGLPEDTSMVQMDSWVHEGRLTCLCAHPRLVEIKKHGWGGLIHHVSKEIALYQFMLRDRPRNFRPERELTNNHYLSGPAACLKLLPPGEQAIIPRYDVPDDVAEHLSLRFGQSRTKKPVCRTCYWMVKKNSPRTGLSLEKDVQVLAHHMKTKHDAALTKDSICFSHVG